MQKLHVSTRDGDGGAWKTCHARSVGTAISQQFCQRESTKKEMTKAIRVKCHSSSECHLPKTLTQPQTKTDPSVPIQAGAQRRRGETSCHLTPEICKCCQLMSPFSFPNFTKPPQPGPHPFFRGCVANVEVGVNSSSFRACR